MLLWLGGPRQVSHSDVAGLSVAAVSAGLLLMFASTVVRLLIPAPVGDSGAAKLAAFAPYWEELDRVAPKAHADQSEPQPAATA